MADDGLDEPQPFVGEIGHVVAADRHPHRAPLLLVVPLPPPDPCDQAVEIEDVDATDVAGQRLDPLVDRSDRSLLTEVDRPVGEPEGGERGLLETVDHEMGAA